jgi:predicted metal-dependent enzyme (double-stranded beta helix superfamily)
VERSVAQLSVATSRPLDLVRVRRHPGRRVREAARRERQADRRERERDGDVTGFAPSGDIHRVRNVGDITAISVHFYGTDVTRVGSSVRRYYDDDPEDNSRT